MPTWTDIQDKLNSLGQQNPQKKVQWLSSKFQESLVQISKLYNEANVICYSSAFLQKPQILETQIMAEDINGFMNIVHGLDTKKGLVLLLHTPGGITTAVETIVDYLHKKFSHITAIVPTYAMSGGTMITLASNKIVMGKQSQLGPIDPQMPFQNRLISARAVIDQFTKAKSDIEKDTRLAHLWAPILQSLGPSLLKEAEQAMSYSVHLVETWLSKRMLSGKANEAAAIAKEFNAMYNDMFVHGRRINIDDVKKLNLIIEEMEEKQEKQDAILTSYHLTTSIFENTSICKIICNHEGKNWLKGITIEHPPPKSPI